MPDGLGPVNPAGIAHYKRFIADLKAAGIKPMLTLYHWDMPAALAFAGGWQNRESVKWFTRYAEVVFANFADEVDLFVLINEPLIDCAFTLAARDRRGGSNAALNILPAGEDLGITLKMLNHILLAAAAAKQSFKAKGYRGQLGMAMPLMPTITEDGASAADRAASILADGVVNRWMLDPIYKGKHPQDILDFATTNSLDVGVQPDDAATIKAAKLDFLGINFYAPTYVRAPDPQSGASVGELFRPDGVYCAFNGPVRPDQFKALLDRIRTDYGNPPVYITENGAGFPGDDVLKDGKIDDRQRSNYIIGHIAALKDAIAAGADSGSSVSIALTGPIEAGDIEIER
jgi:beta-glucosidase